MVYYEKKSDGLSMISIDEETEAKIWEEAKNYKIVKTRTITWEKLDEDRYGEDTDVFVYPLADKDNDAIDFCMIIKDGHFIGVKIYTAVTHRWNAGLNKEESISGCILYIDGKTEGTVTSRSSYDSPNNHDDVEIAYSLGKID